MVSAYYESILKCVCVCGRGHYWRHTQWKSGLERVHSNGQRGSDAPPLLRTLIIQMNYRTSCILSVRLATTLGCCQAPILL